MLNKRAVAVAIWLSMSAVGSVGYSQAQVPLPPRQPRFPPSAQAPEATILSGNDVGFRIDGWKGDAPIGTLLVRVNGQWLEAQQSMQLKRLTSR